MQRKPDPSPEESRLIAEKVRTGEYFRETRQIYDLTVHDIMAERYFYVVLTAIALLTFFIAFIAMRSLYPLASAEPFIVESNDIVEDLPRIESLLAYQGEDPSAALLRFLVNNYVIQREEYDIDRFDRNVGGVRAQSADGVFAEFQQMVNPGNPESPLALYQRHSKRIITIISSSPLEEQDAMEVVFEASIESKNEIKKSRWQANIAFNYSGIALDQNEKVKPVEFTVTEYRLKRL